MEKGITAYGRRLAFFPELLHRLCAPPESQDAATRLTDLGRSSLKCSVLAKRPGGGTDSPLQCAGPVAF